MYLPGVAQGDEVVDVYVAGGGPCSAVVGAEPASARAGTGRVGDYVRAVTLENRLAGVACSRLGDPVGEQVTRVAVLRALSGDGQACELGASVAC